MLFSASLLFLAFLCFFVLMFFCVIIFLCSYFHVCLFPYFIRVLVLSCSCDIVTTGEQRLLSRTALTGGRERAKYCIITFHRRSFGLLTPFRLEREKPTTKIDDYQPLLLGDDEKWCPSDNNAKDSHVTGAA